jgi:hypothetical protein
VADKSGQEIQGGEAAVGNQHQVASRQELSPNFGDGLRVQAAAVWDFEDAGLAATSIPSVNLTPHMRGSESRGY